MARKLRAPTAGQPAVDYSHRLAPVPRPPVHRTDAASVRRPERQRATWPAEGSEPRRNNPPREPDAGSNSNGHIPTDVTPLRPTINIF